MRSLLVIPAAIVKLATNGLDRRPSRRGLAFWAAIPLVLLQSSPVGAQAIADNMSCADAQAYYEQHGRINKIAHGKDVIPIYNGVPVSQKNALHCGFGYVRAAYRTKTLDNRRCTISYYCMASGWD